MRILLIVNDPDLVVAQPYLTLKPGDEILQIAPAADNQEQIRQIHPDLVLVDPNAREIRAHDLAERVHDDLSLRNVPVMLVPGLETQLYSLDDKTGAGAGQPAAAASSAPAGAPAPGLGEQWRADCYSLERQILDSLDQAVVVTGLDGKIVYWNRYAEELYGIPADKVLDRTSEEVLGRRSHFYQEQVIPHLKSGKRWTMEYYVRGQDRRMRPVLLTITPLFDAAGELIGITEIATDISERKENDSRYQRALFNAPFPVVIHAEDGEVIMINRAWTELSGFEPGHMPRMEDWVEKAYPIQQRDEVLHRISQQFNSGERVVEGGESEVRTLRGRQRTWRFSSAPLGRTLDGRRTMISMAVDLTDRREAEDQLQRAISDAPFPIMIHTEDGQVVLLNRVWRDLTGYELDDIPTVNDWMQKAYGERLPEVMELIADQYDINRRVYLDGDFIIDTQDGRQRIWNFSSAPLGFTPDGQRLVMASAADVTERRAVEKRFERAVYDSPYPIVLYAEDGEMLLINHAWTELSGYTLADIPTIQAWTEKAYREKAAEVQAIIQTMTPSAGHHHVGEFHVHTRDGQVRVWDFSTTALDRLPDGRRIRMSVANDVTDRVEMERRFELALQYAPFPLAIYAEDGEFLLINEAFHEYSGYTLADLPNLKTWLNKALRARYPMIEEWVRQLYAQEGRVHKGEFAVCTRDGRERVWDIDGAWLGRLPDGRRLRMFMAVDLTDRKEMEQRFAQAVRYAPFPLSIFAEDGEMLLLNQRFTDLTGYTLLDLPRRSDYLARTRPVDEPDVGLHSRPPAEDTPANPPDQDALPADAEPGGDQVSAEIFAAAPGGEPPEPPGELIFETQNGRLLLWDTTTVPIGHLPDGRRLFMSMAADFTERQQVELRFRRAVEEAPFPIALVADDGEMLSINRAFTFYSGYRLEDIPTADIWLEKAYKQHRAEIEDQIQRNLKLGRYSSGEYAITTRDGRQRIWESNGVPLGQLPDGRKLRMAVSVDITERREVEQRFERAIEYAPFPAMIHAEDGQVLLINGAFEQISGYRLEDIPTLEAYAQHLYGERKEAALAAALNGYKAGGQYQGGEFTLNTKSGRQRVWDFMSVDLGRLPDGRRTRLAMASDVTERKRFEDALRESESKYRSLVESSNLGILVYQDRRIAFANPAFTGLLELTSQDIEGHSLEDLLVYIDSADQPMAIDYIQKAEQGQLPVAFFELRMHTASGRQCWVEISLHPIEYQGRPAIQSLLVDVSEQKKAEDALKESEDRYRQVVEHSTMLIATIADGRVVYINSAGAHLLGFETAEQVVGCQLEELVHPDSYARLVPAAQDLHLEGLSIHSPEPVEPAAKPALFIEQEIIRRNGSRVVLGGSVNILSVAGQPVIHVIAQDFTLRRQAREALRRQAALAQIDLAISRPEELATGFERVADITCQTLQVSLGVVLVLWDHDTGELRLAASSLREEHAALLDCLLDARDSLSTFILQEKKPWIVQDVADDLYDPAYFAATPVCAYAAVPVMVEQQPRGVLYLFEDHPYAFEYDSLEFIDALANRLAMAIAKVDLYEGIREARDAAEAAARTKADFLANMSHELRTPLTTITTLAELLMESQLDAAQLNYMRTILNSAGRLLDLINHVLDFSRLEANKLSLVQHAFDLRRCIESSLDLVAVNAATTGLLMEYFAAPGLPNQVMGDALQLGQVLINLLSNAVKFTESGFVTLNVSLVGPVETGPAGMVELRFTVQDSGIGIPPDRIPLLFQPFSQVDTSPTRKYAGTGLGLVISKHIVELMNGRIWVESDGHSGSSFSFTVQLKVIDEEPAAYLKPDLPFLVGKSVMILTHSYLARKLLQEWIAYWGGQPAVFFQSTQALHWLQLGNRPDLVMADAAFLTAEAADGDLYAYLSQAREDNTHVSGAQVYSADPPRLVALVPFSEQFVFPDALSSLSINPIKLGTLYSLLASIFTRAVDQIPETFDFPDQNTPDQRSLQVLLAEDDPLNRQALTLRLQRLGYEVNAVANGLEVIQAIASGRYDIVFMDFQMPEMDGLHTIRYLRTSYPADRQPFIIGLTADARQETRLALLEAGANLFLTKPVKGDDLALALHQAAERFRTNRRTSRLANWVAWSSRHRQDDPIDGAVFQELVSSIGEDRTQDILVILELFFENSQKMMASIQDSLASLNWVQLRHDLHTLKGSVELLGATQLGKQCKRLELALVDGQTGDMPQQIELLQGAYDAVRQALEVRYQHFLTAASDARQPEGGLS